MSDNQEFYNSKAWKKQRQYIWLKQNCLCAICKRPVYVNGISSYIEPSKRLKGIIHHIKWLDKTNVNDNAIALDENNLIGLCINCHNLIHEPSTTTRIGLGFDENGQLIQSTPTSEIEKIERLRQANKL